MPQTPTGALRDLADTAGFTFEVPKVQAVSVVSAGNLKKLPGEKIVCPGSTPKNDTLARKSAEIAEKRYG